jgi:hypothetical protein
MESSFRSLIPFLSIFCNCQFRRLDSIQFLCSQAHIPSGWRPETRLFTSRRLLFFEICPYNNSARTKQKIGLLCCWKGVFSPLLHSNGSYPIVACVFVAAGMCLPSPCLTMGIHVTFFRATYYSQRSIHFNNSVY